MAFLSVLLAPFSSRPTRPIQAALYATLFLDYFSTTLLVQRRLVDGECFVSVSGRGVVVTDVEEEGKAVCAALVVDLHL